MILPRIWSFPLPKVKGLDFLSDAAGDINAPFNSISNAIYGELQDISDKTGLSRGFQSLQGILSEDSSGFFGPILDPVLNPVAANIVSDTRAQSKAPIRQPY